mgnify:CR=1 FL=1
MVLSGNLEALFWAGGVSSGAYFEEICYFRETGRQTGNADLAIENC